MPQKYQDDCRAFQKPFGSNVPYMEVLHSDVRTVPEQAFRRLAGTLLDEILRMIEMGLSRYRAKLTEYKRILHALNARFEKRHEKAITSSSIERFEQAFENIATKHTRTFGGVLFKPPVSKSAYNDYVQKSVQP